MKLAVSRSVMLERLTCLTRDLFSHVQRLPATGLPLQSALNTIPKAPSPNCSFKLKSYL